MSLPSLYFPIVTDTNTKCVADTVFDRPVYCNEDLGFLVKSRSLENYKLLGSVNPKLAKELTDRALAQLKVSASYKFDRPAAELKELGEFRVDIAVDQFTWKMTCAVQWQDIDDDSYTVFFDHRVIEKPLLYIYYEN